MLKIGILGVADICKDAIIAPAMRRHDVQLTAIAARDHKRAQTFAKEHHIHNADSNYQQVIERDEIDLIYIPLIPSLHAEWACRALRAGKHVLIEKPFAMNTHQALVMQKCAAQSGMRIIEAFHHRYHPLFEHILQLASNGTLGELQHIDARFNVPLPFEERSFRHDKYLGGGVMMDVGCYPVHWARTIAGTEPTVLSADAKIGPNGVELSVRAHLQFPNNICANISSSMECHVEDQAVIRLVGSTGKAYILNPLAPHSGHYIALDTNEKTSQYTFGGNTSYDHQLEAVVQALKHKTKLPTEGRDCLNNMKTIDAIYEAAKFDRTF